MGVLHNFKTGLKLTRSLAHFHGRLSPRPISASFALTNRCNLDCSYCNFPNLDPSELPLSEIETIFDQLASMGVARLGLVGGEPFLRKDLPDIAAAAKKRGFFVSLNTNLTLFARFPERMPAVDLVFTSLDGAPDTHRKARGPKSLDGVLEGIQELVSRDIPVVAITVLTEQASHDIDALCQLAKEHRFKLHFQPQCTDTDIVKGRLGELFNHRGGQDIWNRLQELKSRGAPIVSSNHYLQHMAQWQNFAVSAYQDPNQRCAAGYGFLFIDPQGNAFPCAYTKGKAPAVNLLHQSWTEGFQGETPCSDCAVGPMVEFNLLYQHPIAATHNILQSYGLGA